MRKLELAAKKGGRNRGLSNFRKVPFQPFAGTFKRKRSTGSRCSLLYEPTDNLPFEAHDGELRSVNKFIRSTVLTNYEVANLFARARFKRWYSVAFGLASEHMHVY